MRARVRRRRGRAGVAPTDPADDRGTRGRDRRDSRRSGSVVGSSSGGCTSTTRSSCPGGSSASGASSTIDNPEFQAIDGRRHVAARRPDRAGVSADRRAERRSPADGDARGARHGRPCLSRVPAGRPAGRRGPDPDRQRRSRPPTTRARSRTATRRSGGWPSTSCWRSRSAWSGGGEPAAATTRRSSRSTTPRTPASAARSPRRCRGASVVDRADRRPGHRDGRRPRRPRRIDARCCACSRATSGRARPRSLPTRWPPPPGPGSRGRCWPRPTCSPASTSRRSGPCSADLGIDVLLLTGSLKAAERARANEAIASGQASVVVGTHALFQEAVSFARLGLAIIDEQHRFGVEQRGALEAKADGGVTPHVLLMTATPIPRTLGQVLYADLDVSDLRTPPAGRVPVSGRGSAGRTSSTRPGRRCASRGRRRPSDVRRRATHRGRQRRRRRRQHGRRPSPPRPRRCA